MIKNKKGFSYIEMVIVMGMLLALVTVTTGAIRVGWSARANKAANSVGAALSQSKINALGGDIHYLQIVYRAKDTSKGYDSEGYYVELYHENTNTYHKSDFIGNNRLKIRFGSDETELDSTNVIQIKFNSKSGSVEYAGLAAIANDYAAKKPGASGHPMSAADETLIKFSFGNTYILTLWQATGEHNIS